MFEAAKAVMRPEMVVGGWRLGSGGLEAVMVMFRWICCARTSSAVGQLRAQSGRELELRAQLLVLVSGQKRVFRKRYPIPPNFCLANKNPPPKLTAIPSSRAATR